MGYLRVPVTSQLFSRRSTSTAMQFIHENMKFLWCFKILADRLQKRKGPKLDLAQLMMVLSLSIASLRPMMCMPVVGPRNECTYGNVHVPESQLLKDLLSTCQVGHCKLCSGP